MGAFFRLNRGSSFRLRSRVAPHRPMYWRKGENEIVFVPHTVDVEYIRGLCSGDNPQLAECRDDGSPVSNEPFNKDKRFPNARSIKVINDHKVLKPSADEIKRQEEKHLAEQKKKPPVTSDEEGEGAGLPITEYTVKEAAEFIAKIEDPNILAKLKEDELSRDDRDPRVGILNLIDEAIELNTATNDGDDEDGDDDGVVWD